MSIDLLQEKIRKLKNPTILDLSARPEHIPGHLLAEEGDFAQAYLRFCRELLTALRGTIPAVRLSFDAFALLEDQGLPQLRKLMEEARELGYYVLLDGPEILTPWAGERAAEVLEQWACQGMIVSPYIGGDALKPFHGLGKQGKTCFAVVRTANRSAAQLQDLISGTRVAHEAAMDLVVRFGEGDMGRCGYSQMGALVSATAASSLKRIREKYSRVFLIVDGIDYPSGNCRNCSYAFDKLGHGACVCAGPSITAAWKETEGEGQDYLEKACAAAERLRYNLSRYLTVL